MRENARTEYATRLLAARKHAGFTQTQLAKLAGMSQSSYAQAETTGVGSAYTPQIAQACGVSAGWLATGEGEMAGHELWPFVLIKPEQIRALTPKHLDMVQKFALDLLEAQSLPIASVPPPPNTEVKGSRKGVFLKTGLDRSRSGKSDKSAKKHDGSTGSG